MVSDNLTDEFNELDRFIRNYACIENVTCRQCRHDDAHKFHFDNNQVENTRRSRTVSFQMTRKAIIAAATIILILILAIVVKHSVDYAIETNNKNDDSSSSLIPNDDQLIQRNLPRVVSKNSSHSMDSNSYSALRTAISLTIKQTSSPTTSSSRKFPDLSFYVMGDIPYNFKEEKILVNQLQEISGLFRSGKDESIFIAHVGDFMKSSTTHCRESQYQRVSRLLRANSPLPILTVPGNDDYVNCEDSEKALKNFKRYLLPLDKGTRLHPKIVRDDYREENFAFVHSEVLFIGLNMMPDPRPSPEDPVFLDDKRWLNDQLDLHLNHVRAVILFGHSANGKSVVFKKLNERINQANIPLVMFQGDEHTYDFLPNFGYAEHKDWSNLWRVVVAQGAIAPPVKVTILGDKDFSHGWREDDNGNITTIGGFIKVDRRGGANKSVALADKER